MDTEEVAGSDSLESGSSAEPLSVVDSVSQIRKLLDDFSVKCDAEMQRVQDEFLAKRPRLSWMTIGLAVVVLAITTVTSCVMLSTGAQTGHLLLSSIGELFLFGLVIASGLTDLLWRDPSKLIQAKDDQLARLSGIHDEITKLAEMRQEWEKDVQWHRDRSGIARENLAQLELEAANRKADIDQANDSIRTLEQQEQELIEKTSIAEASVASAEQSLAELTSAHADRTAEIDELSGLLDERKATVQQLDATIEAHHASIKANEETLAGQQETIAGQQELMKELEESVELYKESIAEQQNLIASLESQATEANLFVEELQQQSLSLISEIDKLQAERSNSQLQFELANQQWEQKQRELCEATTQLETLTTRAEFANEIAGKQVLALKAIEERLVLVNVAEASSQNTVSQDFEVSTFEAMVDFATRADYGLNKLASRLQLAERYWDKASAVLYGMESDISDRQQISEALSLQSKMLEDHLKSLEVRNARFESGIDEKRQELERLEVEIQNRQALAVRCQEQLSVTDEERLSIARDLEQTQETVRSIRAEWQNAISAFEDERRCALDAAATIEKQNELKAAELDALTELLQTKTVEFQKCEEELSIRIDQLDELQRQIQFADCEREQKIQLLLGLRKDVAGLADEVTGVLHWQRDSVTAIEAEITARRQQLEEQMRVVDDLHLQIAELENSKSKVQLDLRDVEAELSAKTRMLEQTTESVQQTLTELTATANQIQDSQTQHDRIQSQLNLLTGQLDDMQLECAVAVVAQQDQIADLEDQVSDAAKRLADKLSEIEQAEVDLAAAERNKAQIEAKRDAVESTVQLQQDVLKELADAIAFQNSALEKATLELSRTECDRQAIFVETQNQAAELQSLMLQSEAARFDFDQEKASFESELSDLLRDVQQRQQASEQLRVEFDRVEAKLRNAQQQLGGTVAAVQEKQSELDELSAEIATRKSQCEAEVESLVAIRTKKLEEITRLNVDLDHISQNLAETQNQLSLLNSQNAERLRYAEALDQDVRQAEQALEKLHANYSSKLAEMEELEKTSQQLEEQILENKHLLADLSDDVESQREALVTRAEEFEAGARQFEDQISQLSASRDELAGTVEELTKQVDKTQQELDELERSRIARQTESEEQAMKIGLNRQELDLLADEIQSKQQELSLLESQLAGHLEAVQEAEQRVASALSEYQMKEQQILGLENEVSEYENKILDLRSESDVLKNQIVDFETSLAEKQQLLESQISQAKEVESELTDRSRRLDSLRQEILEADELSKQWQVYVSELQEQKSVAERLRDDLAQKLEALESSLKNKEEVAAERMADLEVGYQKREKELAALDRQLEMRAEELRKIDRERGELQNECAQLTETVQANRDEVLRLSANLEQLRIEQQRLNATAQTTWVRQAEFASESDIQDEAEMTLGRVEGLVSELEEDSERPTIPATESPIVDLAEPPVRQQISKQEPTVPKIASPDPWDDVLS